MSFLSPCIIPIIPSYMTFICGTSLQEMSRAAAPRLKVIARTTFFALGFSLVFVALGLFMGGIGSAIGPGNRIISIVSGALIMGFGLNLIFDFWKTLNRERKVHLLLVAGTGSSLGHGALLLLAYSVGLGLPFLLAEHLFQSAHAGIDEDSAAPAGHQDCRWRVPRAPGSPPSSCSAGCRE